MKARNPGPVAPYHIVFLGPDYMFATGRVVQPFDGRAFLAHRRRMHCWCAALAAIAAALCGAVVGVWL